MLVHCLTLAEGTAGTRVNISSFSPFAYSPVDRPASVHLDGVLVLPPHVHIQIQRGRHLMIAVDVWVEEARKCLVFLYYDNCR